jgi:hypothetical protein
MFGNILSVPEQVLPSSTTDYMANEITDENEFLDQVEKTVNRLTEQLQDSPKSLASHLNYHDGLIEGYCQAKAWYSPRRYATQKKIQATKEALKLT